MLKHWARSTKESAPQETTWALRNPLLNPEQRETRSDRMAEIAREYHKKLLGINQDPNEAPDEEKLTRVLKNISAKLLQTNAEKM